MIAALAKIFGEAMDDIRLEGYLAALEDVPTDALKLGLQRAVRDAKFFPKASELHQWASWEWGRRWRDRCPHEPTCSTPTRCELELDREQRVTRYGEEAK